MRSQLRAIVVLAAGVVAVLLVVAVARDRSGEQTVQPGSTTSTPPSSTTTVTTADDDNAAGPFPQACDEPSDELTDPAATDAARCVFAAVVRWGRSRGDLPIGQQLNTARLHRREPVSTLVDEQYDGRAAAAPAVVGTDLGAILDQLTRDGSDGSPVVDDHVRDLVADARAGRLVVLSWHADSPFTGGGFRDHDGVDLPALLDESTAAGAEWRRQTDVVIDLLRRFADAGVAVAFRPFHEANLRSFWWGQPDPATYRALWGQLRERMEGAGLHNVIWVYSANHRWGDQVLDPVELVPDRYDVFGLDAYDDERADARDRVPVRRADYERIVALGKPFALTEVGPLGSADGAWDPATVTAAVSSEYPDAAWAMFWATFDESERMAIVDLRGHEVWWARCDGGTCPTDR